MIESEDERLDYELDKFMEERGYTCSVAAAKVNELEAENRRLTEWNQNAQSLNGLLELSVERLKGAIWGHKTVMEYPTSPEVKAKADMELWAALEGGDE